MNLDKFFGKPLYNASGTELHAIGTTPANELICYEMVEIFNEYGDVVEVVESETNHIYQPKNLSFKPPSTVKKFELDSLSEQRDKLNEDIASLEEKRLKAINKLKEFNLKIKDAVEKYNNTPREIKEALDVMNFIYENSTCYVCELGYSNRPSFSFSNIRTSNLSIIFNKKNKPVFRINNKSSDTVLKLVKSEEEAYRLMETYIYDHTGEGDLTFSLVTSDQIWTAIIDEKITVPDHFLEKMKKRRIHALTNRMDSEEHSLKNGVESIKKLSYEIDNISNFKQRKINETN